MAQILRSFDEWHLFKEMQNPIKNNINRKFAIIVIVLLVFVSLSSLVKRYADIVQENTNNRHQDIILQQTSDLRARIEHEISTTLNLTMGALVYVSANPDIQQIEFSVLAKRIMQHAPYIKNIGLAKDNIISHIYPLEGNREALGLRYLENANQRDAVIKAMTTRKTVIAGPVNLVQGGRGIISRIPIFLDDEVQSYWGMSSVVVDVDAFLNGVKLVTAKNQLRIALRGKDGKGEQGDVFFGDEKLFTEESSVKLSIPLPTGRWIIAAASNIVPFTENSNSQWLLIGGIFVAAIVSLLLFGLLSSYNALSQAKIDIELASEHKSRFFTNMAHELRTPLTTIHGAVRLINSGVLDTNNEKKKELMDSAERNCSRLIWLINDILDLRKLETGKIEYQMTLQSPMPAIQEAISDIQPYAAEHAIKIELQMDASKELNLFLDNMRIQQVAVNLLSNAVKFSPKNSIISVRTLNTDTHWRLEVADEGVGVPEEKLDVIFKEFEQGSASDKKDLASTGLGLSISRHIINDHEGTIGCYNLKKCGATFYVELPIPKS